MEQERLSTKAQQLNKSKPTDLDSDTEFTDHRNSDYSPSVSSAASAQDLTAYTRTPVLQEQSKRSGTTQQQQQQQQQKKIKAKPKMDVRRKNTAAPKATPGGPKPFERRKFTKGSSKPKGMQRSKKSFKMGVTAGVYCQDQCKNLKNNKREFPEFHGPRSICDELMEAGELTCPLQRQKRKGSDDDDDNESKLVGGVPAEDNEDEKDGHAAGEMGQNMRGFYDEYAYTRALANPNNRYMDRLLLKEGMRARGFGPEQDASSTSMPPDVPSSTSKDDDPPGVKELTFSPSFQNEVGARVLGIAKDIATHIQVAEIQRAGPEAARAMALRGSGNTKVSGNTKDSGNTRCSESARERKALSLFSRKATRAQAMRSSPSSQSALTPSSSIKFMQDVLFGDWERDSLKTVSSGDLHVNNNDKTGQVPSCEVIPVPLTMRPKKMISMAYLKCAWSNQDACACKGDNAPKFLVPEDMVPALGSDGSKKALKNKVADHMTVLRLPGGHVSVFGEKDIDLVTHSGQLIMVGEGMTGVYVLGHLKPENAFVVIKMFKLPFAGGKTREIMDQAVLRNYTRSNSNTPWFYGLAALSPLEANKMGVHDVAMVNRFIGVTPSARVSTLKTFGDKALRTMQMSQASACQVAQRKLEMLRIVKGVLTAMMELHAANMVMPGLDASKVRFGRGPTCRNSNGYQFRNIYFWSRRSSGPHPGPLEVCMPKSHGRIIVFDLSSSC